MVTNLIYFLALQLSAQADFAEQFASVFPAASPEHLVLQLIDEQLATIVIIKKHATNFIFPPWKIFN